MKDNEFKKSKKHSKIFKTKGEKDCHCHDSRAEACGCQGTDDTCGCSIGSHNSESHEGGGSCCDLTPKYLTEDNGKRLDKDTIKQLIFLSVSLVFLVMGYFNWHHISQDSGQKWLLAFYYVNPAWVSIILCGIPIFKKGIRTVLHKKLNASVLISIAMLASIALEIAGLCGVNVSVGSHSHSYVFAAGEVAFLMGVGELLEDITVKKCRSGIQRLVSLIPKEAFVKQTDGSLVKTPLDKINVGDVVVVKSGELVAVDGKIIKGEASIDQSSLTGEYLPVDVSVGDSVYGGTINKNGVIEVEVSKLQKDMTIAKMAELTIEAEGKKAPISRVADKWVGRVVPIVILTSFIVGIVARFAFRLEVVESIVRAVTILVVFCPCALALATPTAVAAGLGNAAKNGVLIKSGEALESLSHADTVCFDKTGTVTEGKIVLDEVVAVDCDEEELVKLAASVEKFSEHPLALAVMKRAEGMQLYDVENIKTLQGIGILAEYSGSEVLVMSYKKAVENGIDLREIESNIQDALQIGKTVAVLLVDGVLQGMLAFSDTLKENAPEVMDDLKKIGLNTVMLTGDNQKSAEYIADKCHIGTVKHGLMPSDKLKEIETLQSSGHKVVMVGDGINDAPSLKLADCSFAMGAMGSDIAIDTADMAILNSDIQKVNDTVRLSKRVVFGIKRNIAIAMTINVIAVVCSLMGWLNPATGALVHNFTSVLVVASSALLLYTPKKRLKSAKSHNKQ